MPSNSGQSVDLLYDRPAATDADLIFGADYVPPRNEVTLQAMLPLPVASVHFIPPARLDVLAEHCERLGRDRSELTVSWQRSACIAPTMDEARAELRDGFLRRGTDLDSLAEAQRDALLARFAVGDPDTVGEQFERWMSLGIDGFTVNMPLNGHLPGRVTLLGEVLSRVVT